MNAHLRAPHSRHGLTVANVSTKAALAPPATCTWESEPHDRRWSRGHPSASDWVGPHSLMFNQIATIVLLA